MPHAVHATLPAAPNVSLVGLVRDRNGKPRIDGDPRALHPGIVAMMNDAEYETACKEYDNAAD